MGGRYAEPSTLTSSEPHTLTYAARNAITYAAHATLITWSADFALCSYALRKACGKPVENSP
jgi:hypothetical protein